MASGTGLSKQTLWAVWLAFACLYALSLGRGFYSSDGDVMFQTTAALAERGTFELAPDPALPQIVAGTGGAAFSKYDPGLPLVGVPFYVLGDWLGAVNHAHRYRLAATAILLVPAWSAAGALAGLAALAGSLFPTRRAVGVALAAGTSTLLWPYARVLFAEATLACALTLATFAIWRAGHGGGRVWWIAAGVAFGAGIATRAALAIYPFDDTLINRTKCAVKLLDLLAAGVAVVAEAVGQNREMIRHGETGWLVEPGDARAFADAVQRLLREPELRQRLGAAAAQDVRQRLAWAQLALAVERAYGFGEPHSAP